MGLFSFFTRAESHKESLDLRGVTDHPLEGERLAGGGLFVLDVPVEKIRVLDFWGG